MGGQTESHERRRLATEVWREVEIIISAYTVRSSNPLLRKGGN